ncbi:TadE/TadG family type IV pilus assembly protein [uncultured Abyssibacter sp.]|uniref:TadE/TadG family type IV pilus assembly protein n=1 Tax=uncultured Abyssibacter sp. TaxID=2320202 RepID=UPI0032B22A13
MVGGKRALSHSFGQQVGSLRRRQRGATALEFAFVFPLLFLFMYGILVYAYIFLLTESLTFVAQEAAESAVAVDPLNNENYEAQVQQRAQQTASSLLEWLPGDQRELVVGSNGELVDVALVPQGGQRFVRVRLEFVISDLFPSITLPLVGQAPPMPEVLRAEASALVDATRPESGES